MERNSFRATNGDFNALVGEDEGGVGSSEFVGRLLISTIPMCLTHHFRRR